MDDKAAALPAPMLLPALTNEAAPTDEPQPSYDANAASNVAPNPAVNGQDDLRLSELEAELAKTQETSQVLVDHVNSLEAQLASCSNTKRFLATKIANRSSRRQTPSSRPARPRSRPAQPPSGRRTRRATNEPRTTKRRSSASRLRSPTRRNPSSGATNSRTRSGSTSKAILRPLSPRAPRPLSQIHPDPAYLLHDSF